MKSRQSKRTPEREARLLEAIRGGSTRTAAALYAGISKDTLYEWLHRYSDFSDALTRVEAEVEVRLTAIILRAAIDDPKHAEWWLERRRPDEYGRRERLDQSIELTGKDGGPIRVDTDPYRAIESRLAGIIARNGAYALHSEPEPN